MKLTLVNADLPSATPAPPLGLASLAHAATQGDHEVTLRDYQLAPPAGSRSPDALASFCGNPEEVLGVSTSGMALPLVVMALKKLKANRPDLVTVLGGIGAAPVAEALITEFPWIDYVCLGEGEAALRELLDLLDRGADTSMVEGFSCRTRGEPRSNPLRPRIRELDSIAAPVWDYLDLGYYPLINISTSRGCPYSCTFCDVAPYWHRCHTKRSVDSVVQEILSVRKKVRLAHTFVFVDDTLTLKRSRVEALCEALAALPPPIEWACYARADTLDVALLNLMGESGCRKVYLGLESGSDHVLSQIRKGFDVETGRRAALTARDYIEIVQTSFVWGFPFESWNDFYETLLMMAHLVANGVSVKANVLTPLPFSTLFAQYAHTMRFLPDYSPQLHLAGYDSHAEFVDLIRKYPLIFPSFYLYESESLTQKYDILRRMGLSPEDIWDVWELVKGPVPLREASSRG